MAITILKPDAQGGGGDMALNGGNSVMIKHRYNKVAPSADHINQEDSDGIERWKSDVSTL